MIRAFLLLMIVSMGALFQSGCAHHRNHDYPPPNYYQPAPANYCVPQSQPCMPVQGASYSPNTQGNWAQPRANCACP
jgi:hypothetical protein